MKIAKIEQQNFRGIKELTLELDGKSAVIFGINGIGKSSILRSIDLLYANIIGKLLNSSKRLADLSEEDIMAGKSRASVTGTFRFASGKEFEYYRSISKLGGKRHYKYLNNLIKYFEDEYITKAYEDEDGNLVIAEDKKNMPVFVNYGVNRLVVDIPLKGAKQASYPKLSTFDKAIESKLDFSALFEWFRIREDLENQEKVRSDMEHEDRDLGAVRTAMLAMLDDFDHIHIERQPLMMVIEKEGVSLSLNQLSDGEKCTLALFGDLARRMAIANPSLANPLKGSGVVLIDELELHMHTQWQRKILRVLKETFPNIQFIVTTHSPQILGEADQDYKIFTLKKEDGEISAYPYSSLFGWDSNVILEELMGTGALSQQIKDLSEKMFEAVEMREFEAAEVLAARIDELTGGRNNSTTKARVQIARGRRNEKNHKE